MTQSLASKSLLLFENIVEFQVEMVRGRMGQCLHRQTNRDITSLEDMKFMNTRNCALFTLKYSLPPNAQLFSYMESYYSTSANNTGITWYAFHSEYFYFIIPHGMLFLLLVTVA